MAFTEGRVRPKKNFEIDNIATNKNLKHSTKDVVVSSHSKEESLVIDKKSHPTYVSDPKRSRQATTLPEKADHRMETKNQRTNVSNSGRMIDASMSITPNSNKVVETRESNTYLAPSLASDKRSSTKLDEPQLASKSQHLKGTETIPPTSFLPRKKSNDAKNDKPQNCDGSTVRFSTAPEMRVRQTNIAMSEKAGDNNMGTDKSTKKEESVMSNNATLINKYTGVRMRSNSIHSLKVDRQSISDSSAANTSVDGPMPLKKHQKVEKHGMSNVPVQRSMPSDKKIVQAEKHLEVSSSLAQKSFLLTSPIPLKSSHMNNLKLAESDRLSSVSEKGTNEFNLLVTPECKNQEKSLLRLKTPVNSTKQPDSSTIKPMSLHVIDDQKCLNPGNELEAVSRSDMKPNRAAVSPEQSKKDKTNLPENPVIEKSKSISKFFKDASGQKRSKAASNKKDIRKRTETSKEEITEAAKKRRQLYQESKFLIFHHCLLTMSYLFNQSLPLIF
jgi:gas vesicle protein